MTVRLAALGLLLAALAHANGRGEHAPLARQAPRDAPPQVIVGTGLVTGTAFTGPAGPDPARKARVMLGSVDRRVPGQTAATDDDGRFEFRGVPAGRYTIEVQKAGYLRASYGAARPGRAGTPVSVSDGGRVDGLTIRLLRGAAISGTVRNARGRPLPGVSVTALRYDWVLGERRLSPQSSMTTDDQGTYRLWGLSPGDYVVAATLGTPGSFSFFPTNDFALLTPADVDRASQGAPSPGAPPLPPVPTGTYSPVFFPAASDLALATKLVLAAGDDREGIDVVASLVRTAKIEGAVTTQDGQAVGPARITLTGAGDAANLLGGTSVWRARPTTLDTQGRFTYYDVPPGKHTLLALSTPPASAQGAGATPTAPTWAMAEVTVNGADVAVSLTMQPAMTITGKLVFDGASPPPDNPTALSIRLVPPGSGGNIGAGPPGGVVNADRTFSFSGVTPGEYRMLTLMRSQVPWGWSLRSAIANGHDALEGPLKIAPGENPELVLTYTDRPTEISGQFQDATGRPAPDYFIVIFPVDRDKWTPGSRRIVSTRPGNDGRYTMRGLPPGEYLLAALTDLDPQDLNATAFFDQLVPLAVKVTLAEGVAAKQDLRVGR